MNIKKNIISRAKYFILKEGYKEVLKRNDIINRDVEGIPVELMEMLESIKNYKEKSKILLDIGAHKGLFSKAANAFMKFDHTICFEPNSALNPLIKENNKKINLTIENIALSDNNEGSIYYLHQDETMNSIIKSDEVVLRSEFPWDNPDLMKSTVVKTMQLDEYMMEKWPNTNQQVFIKIDTQGNELNILRNGLKTLQRTEICLIEFMFLNPYSSDFNFYTLIDFMRENNFDCKGALSIKKRPSKKVSAVDFLFLKN